MKIAESSRQKLERFFCEYYKDENFDLPQIYIYCGRFTKALTGLIKVEGITFGKRIYILPERISTDSDNKRKLSESLAAHEIVHTLQYKQHGFVKFFYRYVKDYWENLKTREKWDLESRQQAYFNIPFEIEARQISDKFVKWCQESKRNKK